MNIVKKLIFIPVVFLFFLTGCEKNKENTTAISSQDSIYYYIDGLMNYWYLWNDSVPDVDYLSYSTPQDLINDLKVSIDQWSFVDKASTVNSLFEEGQDFGYGFFLGWDNDVSYPTTNLRVIFAYNNTDAYAAGIRRGCIVEEIDGVPSRQVTDFDPFFSTDPGSMTFKFLDNSGVEHTVTLTKKTYNMNAVLYANTYNVNGKTTGYMVFQSFLGYSQDELEQTIDFFKSAGITELVVDLRYNGGGYVSLAEELANMIIPSSAVGQPFYTMKHNKDRSAEYDTTVVFHSITRDLNLNRVFFITNQYSASASELLINGLKPHLDVIQIGTKTYGKPVAMYGFSFQDWLIYPVTAKSVNSEGYGDYYNGLTPDEVVIDQHKFDWGDENEPDLSEAFYYITNGTFAQTASSLKSAGSTKLVSDKELHHKNLLIMDR